MVVVKQIRDSGMWIIDSSESIVRSSSEMEYTYRSMPLYFTDLKLCTGNAFEVLALWNGMVTSQLIEK